jgi:hypothetical protein
MSALPHSDFQTPRPIDMVQLAYQNGKLLLKTQLPQAVGQSRDVEDALRELKMALPQSIESVVLTDKPLVPNSPSDGFFVLELLSTKVTLSEERSGAKSHVTYNLGSKEIFVDSKAGSQIDLDEFAEKIDAIRLQLSENKLRILGRRKGG